jgi:fructan beta-fructosidase
MSPGDASHAHEKIVLFLLLIVIALQGRQLLTMKLVARRHLGAVLVTALTVVLYFISCSSEELLFENSDFEKGGLENWTTEGEAFKSQPTFDDNIWLRKRGNAKMQGRFWVGTYENRHSELDHPGRIQGDQLTGRLISKPFIIKHRKISFLIGAGDITPRTSVVLRIEGKDVIVALHSGMPTDSESMERMLWDVSPYRGKQAQIIIIDEAIGPWGHINVDNFLGE